jgi:hypothetical protein
MSGNKRSRIGSWLSIVAAVSSQSLCLQVDEKPAIRKGETEPPEKTALGKLRPYCFTSSLSGLLVQLHFGNHSKIFNRVFGSPMHSTLTLFVCDIAYGAIQRNS